MCCAMSPLTPASTSAAELRRRGALSGVRNRSSFADRARRFDSDGFDLLFLVERLAVIAQGHLGCEQLFGALLVSPRARCKLRIGPRDGRVELVHRDRNSL